jgi:hypothetical protein
LTQRHLAPTKLDFGVFRCCRWPWTVSDQGDPLSGFASTSEFYQQLPACSLRPHPTLTSAESSARCDVVTNHLPRFRPFSVLTAGRSLKVLALSTATKRCALRVLHPLDALLPAGPSEFISPRFRSWDLPLQGITPEPMPPVLSNCVTLLAFRVEPFNSTLYLQALLISSVAPTRLPVIHPPCCASLPGVWLLRGLLLHRARTPRCPGFTLRRSTSCGSPPALGAHRLLAGNVRCAPRSLHSGAHGPSLEVPIPP